MMLNKKQRKAFWPGWVAGWLCMALSATIIIHLCALV